MIDFVNIFQALDLLDGKKRYRRKYVYKDRMHREKNVLGRLTVIIENQISITDNWNLSSVLHEFILFQGVSI